MSRNRQNNLIEITNNKYNRLLFFIVLLLLAAPFSQPSGFLGLLIPIIFFWLLFTAIYSFLKSKALILYLIVAGILLLLQILALYARFSVSTNLKIAILISFVNIIFMALSIYFVIGEIFTRKIITADAIKGVIVAYILLGSLWFYLYKLISLLSPNSFSNNTDFELLYLSFITLTTVGYGDILPLGQFAKILANLEGIIGVLYPTIFIARLVGLYQRD